jgi:DNA replication ATP-dependent helicase Dna2
VWSERVCVQVGNLVKDWRRMNVAFTRARSKLVIIGSAQTLRHSDVLLAFINYAAAQGWMLTLPPKAHNLHVMAKPVLKRAAADENDVSVPVTPEKTLKRRKGGFPPGGIGILKDLKNEFDSP